MDANEDIDKNKPQTCETKAEAYEVEGYRRLNDLNKLFVKKDHHWGIAVSRAKITEIVSPSFLKQMDTTGSPGYSISINSNLVYIDEVTGHLTVRYDRKSIKEKAMKIFHPQAREFAKKLNIKETIEEETLQTREQNTGKKRKKDDSDKNVDDESNREKKSSRGSAMWRGYTHRHDTEEEMDEKRCAKLEKELTQVELKLMLTRHRMEVQEEQEQDYWRKPNQHDGGASNISPVIGGFYNRPWDRTYGNNPEADFDYHGGPSGYIQSRLWGGNMSGNNSEGGYYDDGGRSEYSRKCPWSTGMLDDKPGSSFDRARWESNQKLD